LSFWGHDRRSVGQGEAADQIRTRWLGDQIVLGADFGLARERAVRRCESWDVPPPLHFAQYPMGPQSPGDEVCRFELEYSDGSQRLDAGVPPAM